ncbi:hypothetical protein U9443_23335, partial [Escherichia coli]
AVLMCNEVRIHLWEASDEGWRSRSNDSPVCTGAESFIAGTAREGANKRGNSSRLTQSFHFFMFEPIFSPVNALNQPI